MTDTEPRIWPFFAMSLTYLALFAMCFWFAAHTHPWLATVAFFGALAALIVTDRMNEAGEDGEDE